MSDIEVRPVDDDGKWNGYLEHASTPTPFHRAGALDVLADEVDATLHRLGGFKGQEPVGVFPLFEVDRGPVTGVFSPPPDLKVPYLGPSVVARGDPPKRRRLDRQHREFVDAAVEHVREEVDPGMVQIRTPPGYEDVRPFSWQEYEVEPRYTYVVDISRDRDELLSSFSSDARKNVTNDYDVDYELVEGSRRDIRRIVEQTAARHEEQDEEFPIDADFVLRLYETLPDGIVRPLVCRIDGEFVAGTVNLEADDIAVRWVGAAKPSADLPANDLLDWEYARRASDRGVEAFDLAGANEPRIANYKAKFAPDLVPYYRLKSCSRTMDVAVSVYDKLR